jgi:reticulon-4-interacting protein 1, mitochondrial
MLLSVCSSGIVEAVGKKIKIEIEIGDEVWVAADFWDKGLAAEYVVVRIYIIYTFFSKLLSSL